MPIVRRRRTTTIRILTALAASLALLGGAASASAKVPSLKLGMGGPSVVRWQTIMNTLPLMKAYREEHGAIGVDGRYGATTMRATMAFQRLTGITVDGVVGPGAWGAYVDRLITPTTKPRLDLKAGNMGVFVSWWQIALDRWLAIQGRDGVIPDGRFAPATVRWTKAFQKAHDLPADGIVGKKTWLAATDPNLIHIP